VIGPTTCAPIGSGPNPDSFPRSNDAHRDIPYRTMPGWPIHFGAAVTKRRMMIAAERIEELERIAKTLVGALASLRIESAVVTRHPADQSDEAKRERSAARALMRKRKAHAAGM
jgi:hypothetical protein